MKRIVLNISDTTYEKLRFEALIEKKSIQQIIRERLFNKPFENEVEKALEELMSKEIDKITKA
jgi:hypothetical protein